MCRNKKRYLQRDEQHVKLGLKFFNDWYKRAMGAKKPKTYEEFMRSQYYGAFVRFGLYVLEARVLSPEKYLEWLIVTRANIDKWGTDSVYNAYLAEQSKKETAERAVERYVLHAEKWSEKTGNHWTEYWQKANINVIINDIKMGKISPWVILSYTPARDTLNELPGEMLNDVADTLDLAYWNRKIAVNKPTVKWIEEILS
jgi:hypothetical protein